MGKPIEVSVVVDAPIEAVWDDLAQIGSHAEWMRDAEAIEFMTEQRQGAGTKVRVPTRIGPLTTVDEIEFTEWEPPTRMAIVHHGLFSGSGEISLQSTLQGTVVTWRESIRFPLRFGGRLGEVVARPILALVWKGNLKRLAARFA